MIPIIPPNSPQPNPPIGDQSSPKRIFSFGVFSFLSGIWEQFQRYWTEQPTTPSPITNHDIALLPTNWSSPIFLAIFRQLNRQQQMQVLGLDKWLTEGNKAEACNRIIHCVLERGKELNLSFLWLTSLPDTIDNLTQLETLNICFNKLTFLPETIGNLSQLETLDIASNKLTSLPDTIGNLLQLKKLDVEVNKLTSLPDTLGNLLQLEKLQVKCNELTSLPESIGNFPQLKWLNLYTNRLTGLPNSILQLAPEARIELTNSGLSNDVLDRLQEQTRQPGYNGPQFSISVRENRSTEEKSYEMLVKDVYESIRKPVPDALSKLIESPAHKADLQSWLNRLSWTADGQNNLERRLALFKTITDILEYAAENEEYRALFQTILMDASSTCGDRVALSILLLDVTKQIAIFDKKNLKGLADLIIRGQFILGILEEIARNKIPSLKFFDEIEVYFAYPIFLKETFNLPIHTDGMLYFTCSGLTKQDIKDAEEIVHSRLNDENLVINYLVTNDVWRQALELNFPTAFKDIMDRARNNNIDPKPAFIDLTKANYR